VDLITILFVTGAVLGVLLLVLVTIAVVVLLPAVRRSLAERAASIPPADAPDPDDDGAGQP
jgi:hypothetical protein